MPRAGRRSGLNTSVQHRKAPCLRCCSDLRSYAFVHSVTHIKRRSGLDVFYNISQPPVLAVFPTWHTAALSTIHLTYRVIPAWTSSRISCYYPLLLAFRLSSIFLDRSVPRLSDRSGWMASYDILLLPIVPFIPTCVERPSSQCPSTERSFRLDNLLRYLATTHQLLLSDLARAGPVAKLLDKDIIPSGRPLTLSFGPPLFLVFRLGEISSHRLAPRAS